MNIIERSKNLHKAVTSMIILSFALTPSVFALPENATVQAGDVTFTNPNESTLNINQMSDKAIIDWIKFCIENGQTVNFIQPGSDSIALNRVTGPSISEIFGALNANGKVWLLNPNGILFGPSSKINAPGFLASTLNIKNDDFLDKVYAFTKSPDSNGYIINKGQITAGDGGYVALLGNAVKNEGIVQAKLGKVVLASGEKMALELDSDGIISVVIDEPISEIVKDRDENDIKDAVSNKGTITADGGIVILTASVLEDLFEKAVNNEGLIKANSLVKKEGGVYLLADGKNAMASNTGTIDVSAVEPGCDGGFAEVSGDRVGIDDGNIDVSSIDGESGHLLLDPFDLWIVDDAIGDDKTGSTVGELWLENFNGNITLQATNDVFFLIKDNLLNLVNFDTETFRVEAGNDINLNNDSITTQGGGVELLSDYSGGVGVAGGAGDVNLGIGKSINTNRGHVILSGANVNITSPINTSGGHVDVAASNNILQGPNGDINTSGGHYIANAVNDYIFMNDSTITTGGGAFDIIFGGTIIPGSPDPQTEWTYAWEYITQERSYHLKEFGYYYYDGGGGIVYVPLVQGPDIGKDGTSLLSGAGVVYDDIGGFRLYIEIDGGGLWRFHQEPHRNKDGFDHIKMLGETLFGWEDIVYLGDKDFNDVVTDFVSTMAIYKESPVMPEPEVVSATSPLPFLLWDLRFKIPQRHLTEALQVTYTNGPIELLAEQIYFYHPLIEMDMYEMQPLGTDFYEFIEGRIDTKNPALLPMALQKEEEEKK